MGNEKTQTPATQPAVASATRSAADTLLSEAQMLRIQRTLLYGLAMFGTLASGRTPTPSKKNLEELKRYVDVVLGMANGD